MQVVVTGASGLVGTALVKALRARATPVTAVSRRPALQPQIPGVTWIGWDGLTDAVAGAAGVVHLAGAGIVDKRWSSERKTLLRSSRVERTRQVVEAITESGEKPAVLVSASAIGYYGNETSRECTELAPPGNDFLARLCQDWEAATEAAGVRTVKLRFGIVLSSEGGALAKLLLPFRFGLGWTDRPRPQLLVVGAHRRRGRRDPARALHQQRLRRAQRHLSEAGSQRRVLSHSGRGPAATRAAAAAAVGPPAAARRGLDRAHGQSASAAHPHARIRLRL